MFGSIGVWNRPEGAAKSIRLNTYWESIGTEPAPRNAGRAQPSSEGLKRSSRSRNSEQSTRGLSIQKEVGSPNPGCPVPGSSYWWTCHWGGYRKTLRSIGSIESELERAGGDSEPHGSRPRRSNVVALETTDRKMETTEHRSQSRRRNRRRAQPRPGALRCANELGLVLMGASPLDGFQLGRAG